MANLATAMDAQQNRDDVVAGRVLPSWSRLLLFAVLLPAAIAIADQLLLRLPWSQQLRLGFYPWLAASTAVLSWCTARYLYPAWLRWFIFLWCLALLDFLTITACMDGKVDDHIGYVLVSAQVSLAVLWAILSPVPWQLRMPGIIVLVPIVMTFSKSFADRWTTQEWSLPMLLTTVAVALMCVGLRLMGFSLRQEANTAKPQSEAELGARQFGVKHMLIWAAALGPLLIVLRGLDFLVLKSAGWHGLFAAGLMALSVATVNLTAIWAVLGKGPWFVRLLALVVIPLALAAVMNAYTNYVLAYYTTSIRTPGGTYIQTTMGPGRLRYSPMLGLLFEIGETWISWLCLDAALLAALLLFLRASGYRLMRISQHASSDA